jgi:hypothetical protein
MKAEKSEAFLKVVICFFCILYYLLGPLLVFQKRIIDDTLGQSGVVVTDHKLNKIGLMF